MKGVIINDIDLSILNKYGHQISNLDKKTFMKIEKYKACIKKSINEDYKYGSSWLDLFILQKKLIRFEKLLHKCGINVNIANNVT